MRNPNGYGTVYRLKGNRRRPWVARVTVGWKENGQPKYLYVGYHATQAEALMELAKYNGEPWDVDGAKATMAGLFELWKEKKAPKLGAGHQSALFSAYRHCRHVHKRAYKDLRAHHMQECVDGCGKGASTQGAIKNLFRHLDRFAREMDMLSTGYSDLLTTAPAPETSRRPFTDAEVARVWGNEGLPWADTVLVLLYTGFRISELLDLKPGDFDPGQMTLTGGTKTRSGKNRVVPVHDRIAPIILRWAGAGGEYLLTHNGRQVTKRIYYLHWDRLMETLGLAHTPHECRHTFGSRLDSAGANRRCIDLLMGHASRGVGERTYTHKTVEELRAAVGLLE